ncbi:MAG: hypothetical protein OXH70_14015 [Acidobacteria bacterium]|nr:hypothetical protein [Acidobacteriota bacterium]
MALKLPEVPHLAVRHAALREFGFRPHQAAWLTLVCLHSGVFTRTQFTEHHRCSTKTTHAFVHRLVAADVARERPMPGAGTRLRYTHVHDRRLYRAPGVEKLRHRRNPKENVVLFRRLLSFDHVIRHPYLPWLATEEEKVAHFEARGIRRHHLPSRIHGGTAADPGGEGNPGRRQGGHPLGRLRRPRAVGRLPCRSPHPAAALPPAVYFSGLVYRGGTKNQHCR